MAAHGTSTVVMAHEIIGLALTAIQQVLVLADN
jgi:hypothetical protein